jgi:hypothetical protein
LPIYDETYSTPNFGYPKGTVGRGSHKPLAICLHISGAAWQSNYQWIMNPAANASYNAIVKDDGSIVSLVPEGNAAYSHGRINKATWPLLRPKVNPNLYTLSLARTGSNQKTWTPEQLRSTLKVLRYWGTKYNIPLRRPYIFGHFEIDSVDRWYCPGRDFFERVIAELANEGEINCGLNLGQADSEAEAGLWHRVIAGSYRDPLLAEKQAAKLRKQGIEAFVLPWAK